MNTPRNEITPEAVHARISTIQHELTNLDYIPDPYAQAPVDPRDVVHAQELWQELYDLMAMHSVDLPV